MKELGKLDNTLIIYIEGDNGTSAEGSRSESRSTLPQLKDISYGRGTAEVL